MSASVAVVVLSWNDCELTVRCLDSLASVTYPDARVILVDNGSNDDTVEVVARTYPEVELVRLSTNRGFAGGVNTGIEAALRADVEHVFLLNNDATVEPGVLQPLVGAVSRSVGAACSQILQEGSGTIWYAGARYDPRRGHQGRHTGYGRPALAERIAPYPTDRGCGGAMLVPRAALERVGASRRGALRLCGGRRLVASRAGARPRDPRRPGEHRPSSGLRRLGRSVVAYDALLRASQRAHRRRAIRTARTSALARPSRRGRLGVRRPGAPVGLRLAGLRAVLQGLRDASRRRLGPRAA